MLRRRSAGCRWRPSDFGVTENRHVDACWTCRSPGASRATRSRSEPARSRRGVLEALDVVGVLCVEFFLTREGRAVDQRACAAAAQQRPLEHRCGAHLPVRAAAPRGVRTAARRFFAAASGGDGESARRSLAGRRTGLGLRHIGSEREAPPVREVRAEAGTQDGASDGAGRFAGCCARRGARSARTDRSRRAAVSKRLRSLLSAPRRVGKVDRSARNYLLVRCPSRGDDRLKWRTPDATRDPPTRNRCSHRRIPVAAARRSTTTSATASSSRSGAIDSTRTGSGSICARPAPAMRHITARSPGRLHGVGAIPRRGRGGRPDRGDRPRAASARNGVIARLLDRQHPCALAA